MTPHTILIIDDEENLRSLLARIIELEGFTVLQAKDSRSASSILEREEVKVVVTDVKLPDANGVELTSKIKARYPATEVIVLTAFGTIEDGVKAIKNGAFDYLTKGDHSERIIPLLNKAVEKAVLQYKVTSLEKKLARQFGFEQIIGTSKTIVKCIELAKRVATSDSAVLLTGETGTGKEVFANAIHYESTRRQKPFVAINCSAISRELLESELFGHATGAFTGANKDKKGLVDEANGGTLFLDEVGELNLELQAKLLRVLETGEHYRVGDSKVRKADVRILAATNRNLEKESGAGNFRSDLFYRLSVFQIELPPLRDRKEDIEALAHHFVQRSAAKNTKRIASINQPFIKALQQHTWKGNIRELKNVLERCVILSTENTLTIDLLPADFNLHTEAESSYTLTSVEKIHISKVLEATLGNKTQAAKLLGIGLTTLYQKIKDYNL